MKKTILLLSLVTVFIACSKENDGDNNENNPITPQEQNTFPTDEATAYGYLHESNEKTWVAKEFNLSTVGSQSCRLDDAIVFNSDMTYSYDNGSTKCGGDLDMKDGNFEIDFENKVLIFDSGTSEERVADIVSLSNDRIVVTGGWSIYQIKATFVAQ